MAKNNKQLTLVQEMRSKNNPQLTLQQEQRLYELYKKDNIEDIKFFDAYKSCKNVVVFGNHGCGRSTVINSLLGHQLKSIPHSYLRDYFLIDLAAPHNQRQLKISHDYYNPGQQKLIPVSVEGATIWECPGLYKRTGCTKGIEDIEPQEEEMKMIESPRIMQLLKTVNSVKFILVADDNDLTVSGGYRGEEFLATVDRIASIFSDLDLIKESILLVITKAPSFETQEGVVRMIDCAIKYRDMSDHTKTLMKYLTKSPIYIFYKPEKVGEEVEGPTLELIKDLPSCDVRESIQYPGLSPMNQELALGILQKDNDARIQEEEAKRQLEQAEINIKNNAWFFIKVVEFLYTALSSMSILTKASQYAGGILMNFSSLIGINNLFKNYGFSNKPGTTPEENERLQPMSPEKAKLAKCLVKILNDNEALSKEFNQKFNECIEQYTNCKNDEEKQSIVKQFSEWIISETNLKNELLAFEDGSHISPEGYNSSESSASSGEEGGGQKPGDLSGQGQKADQEKEIEVKELDQGEDANTLRRTQAIEQSSGTPNQQDRENNDNREMESNNNDSLDDKNVGKTIDKVANNSDFDADLGQVVVKELESSGILAKLGQVEDDKKPNDHKARGAGSNFIRDKKDSGQSNSSATQPNNHEENVINILRDISAPNTDTQEALYDFLDYLDQQLNHRN